MSSHEEDPRKTGRRAESPAVRRRSQRRATGAGLTRVGTPAGSGSSTLGWKKKLAFSFFVWCLAVLILYASSLVIRSYRLYGRLKTSQRGWAVQIHQPDAELGFRPIPNVESAELFPIGDAVPTRFDKRGFRVPTQASEPANPDGPLILAMGCSFTYGAACRAEETFSYLLAQRLHGRSINAGVCSYGLTQILLRARQIIPQFRPDIVIVQYSPWLVDRTMETYAPTYFGRQPVPYFAKKSDGSLAIEPPVFSPSVIDPRAYRTTPRSISDYGSFLAQAALPLFLHDDVLASLTWFKQRLRIIPPPTDDRQAIVDLAYGELDRLCRDFHAELIIVILDERVPPDPRESLVAASHATIVDAHAKLIARLPVPDQLTFQRFYALWRGDPPILVDHHPNSRTHEIIADEIMQAIERKRSPKTGH